MKSLKHTHVLRKIRGTTGDNLSFMCNDPKCTWKQPADLLDGKQFKCPYCNQPYLLTRRLMRLRFPHCKLCTKGQPREIITEQVLEQLPAMTKLDELLGNFDEEIK